MTQHLQQVVSQVVRKHDEEEEAAQAAAREKERQESKPGPYGLREEDVFAAWELLSPAGHSVLTKSQVLDSLRAFFPHISAREVKELVGSGNMSVDKLRNLLFKSEVPEFDPNYEAFKILDPHGTGFVDAHVLRRMLMQMPGVDYLDDADMDLIMRIADPDEDGRVSLEDFKTIGSWAPPPETPTEAIRRIMVERLRAEQESRRD